MTNRIPTLGKTSNTYRKGSLEPFGVSWRNLFIARERILEVRAMPFIVEPADWGNNESLLAMHDNH